MYLVPCKKGCAPYPGTSNPSGLCSAFNRTHVQDCGLPTSLAEQRWLAMKVLWPHGCLMQWGTRRHLAGPRSQAAAEQVVPGAAKRGDVSQRDPEGSSPGQRKQEIVAWFCLLL